MGIPPSLPPCGEAINRLIAALSRLPRAARGCPAAGGCVSSLAPSPGTPAAKGAAAQMAGQAQGPPPLQEEEVVVIQGRVRRARGRGEERGGGRLGAMNTGPNGGSVLGWRGAWQYGEQNGHPGGHHRDAGR